MAGNQMKLSMEESPMKMKLEEMPKRDLGCSIFIFTIFFVVGIIFGVLGPSVYTYQYLNAFNCPSGVTSFNETLCEGTDLSKKDEMFGALVSNLDKFDRELIVEVEFENKNYTAAAINEKVLIDIILIGGQSPGGQGQILNKGDDYSYEKTVKCSRGNKRCNSVELLHITFIEYKYYTITIVMNEDNPWIGNAYFTFKYVNAEYTVFELWFRIIFLLTSIGIFIWFIKKMKQVSSYEWTLEQKWMVLLMIGLIFLNNPLYVFTITTDHIFPYVINNMFMFGFLATLLTFWLCLLDAMSKSSTMRTIQHFYAPKVLLVGILWVFAVAAYSLISKYRNDDPRYSPGDDVESVKALLAIYFIFVAIYIIWFGYLVYKALKEIQYIQHMRMRVRIFLGLTIAVVLITIIGMIAGAVDSVNNNAASFLIYFCLFNTYIWLMIHLYSPAKFLYQGVNMQMTVGMASLDENDLEAEFVHVELDRESPNANVFVVEDGTGPGRRSNLPIL
eukprot:TRINITY_DN1798_c0_g1_i2.p1 TRINITY_DN1798_c0_g1~~TRINITY_DN1798_c0_g1_i2.p1  ORF type:complete len:502 (-),score=71.21 TRINITY_DN1798_c0_g1_i2:955-2460(-)